MTRSKQVTILPLNFAASVASPVLPAGTQSAKRWLLDFQTESEAGLGFGVRTDGDLPSRGRNNVEHDKGNPREAI
jgi:hypothetical protein